MGSDKAQLLWRGQSFAEAIASLLTPWCQEVVRVGGEHQDTDLTDVAPDGGPLAGILAALEAYEQDRLMVVSCDTPALCIEDIKGLMRTDGAASYADAADLRRWPLPAIIPGHTLAIARARFHQGQRSLHGLLDAIGAACIPVTDPRQRRRVRGANSREELEAMRVQFEDS